MDLKKEAFLEAYIASFGNITESCKAVDISRTCYYKWMESDPEFKAQIDNAEPNEVFVDFAETALMKRIKAEDTTAIIFALKTKGKKRGYVERTELSGPDGEPITLAFEKVPSFMTNMETKSNGQKGLQTKGGFIPQ